MQQPTAPAPPAPGTQRDLVAASLLAPQHPDVYPRRQDPAFTMRALSDRMRVDRIPETGR